MEPTVICKADIISRDHMKLYRQEYAEPTHIFLYRVGELDTEKLRDRLPVRGFYTRGRPENNPLCLPHEIMGWDTANGRLVIYVLGCGRVVLTRNFARIKTYRGPDAAASAIQSVKCFLGIESDIKLQRYTTVQIVRDCVVMCDRYYI